MTDSRRTRSAPPTPDRTAPRDATTAAPAAAPAAAAPTPAPTPAAPAPTRVATVPTRAEISEAVRQTPVGTLSDEAREMIRVRAERNATVAKVMGTIWAKESLSPNSAMALANYCYDAGLDPMQEIDVLGGKVYVNGKYAIRRLSELQHAGKIHDYNIQWIHHDERLVGLANGTGEDAEWARTELRHRSRERIERNVPDSATSAAVCRIWLVGMESTPAIGTKWHEKGRKITRKSKEGGTYQKDADPVGDQFPMETLETRAIRRAMRMLAKEAPDVADALVDMESKVATINAKIADDRQKTRSDAAANPLGRHQLSSPGGAYGDSTDDLHRITTGAPARERTAQVAALDAYEVPDDVSVDDVGDDDDVSVDVTADETDADAPLTALGDAALARMLDDARTRGDDRQTDAIEQELETRRLDRDEFAEQ